MIVRIVSSYSATTHLWLPIISRGRVHVDLNIPVETISLHAAAGREPLPPALQNPQTTFYVDVRECHFLKAPAYYPFISCKQDFSSQLMNLDMQYFQTLTLQLGAVQELAMQWVFTMGQAYGAFCPPTSWTEMEERSRVWWAVFLLDRLLHLGNPALPFSVQDPDQEDHPPCSETGWIEGD